MNAYLSGVMPGLTAKVFRTYHATKIVENALEAKNVRPDDPEYKKWEAAVFANLDAAKLCNHYKMPPKNLDQRKERYNERLQRAIARVGKYKDQITEYKEKLKEFRQEFSNKKAAAKKPAASISTVRHPSSLLI